MAEKNYVTPLCLFLIFLCLSPCVINARKLVYGFDLHPLARCHFRSIYQLGDSISDTGNLVIESPDKGALFTRFPYGETIGEATGRCSNGLLMIDFFALASGLPFLNPYKIPRANVKNGVNFAVAGATALSSESLMAKGFLPNSVTNSSLEVQLEWMANHFNSTCRTRIGCQKMLRRSLFMVGEVGGNDLNYALLANKTMKDLMELIPDVVRTIEEAVRRVIGFGAKRVVIPGNFPIGCHPIYLSILQTNDTNAYDSNHCLKGLNSLASEQNQLLQESIQKLKKEYPNTAIVYGDYYNAYLSLLSNARKLGFDENSLQEACCGSGGLHNFALDKMCGMPGVPACPNPRNHISWDGIHMTQQAYRFMADYLIKSIVPQLHCH